MAHLEEDPPSTPERLLRTFMVLGWMAFVAVIVAVGFSVIYQSGWIFQKLGDPEPVQGMTPRRIALAIGMVLLIPAFGLVLFSTLRSRRRSLQARSGPTLQPTGAPDCPFCKATLARADLTDGVVRCPACEVAHHADCWREHGGCSTHACARSGRARERAGS